MTLLTYSLLLILSVILIFFRIKGRRLSAAIVGTTIIIWSVVVRIAEPSVDIAYYNAIMTGEISPLLLGYFNEPVLWFFQMYLYRLTEDVFFTWFLGDVVLLSLCFVAIKNLRFGLNMDPQSRSLDLYYPAIFAVILVSWPYFIGLSLTYRQFAAETLLLYSVSLVRASPTTGVLVFIAACLTHNSVAFFAPMIGVLTRMPTLQIPSVLVAMAIPLVFIFVVSERESRYVGGLLAMAYPIFVLTVSVFMAFLVKYQKINVSKELFFINVFFPYLMINAWLFLPNGHAERFGQLTLAILFPILLVFVVNKFRDRRFILTFMVVFCATPTLSFYGSMLS